MSGWHSLSGYLYYKQGGVLGKIFPKARHWYVLDEKNCCLVYFKSREACKAKDPEGSIELRSAGISLNPSEDNQFIILSDGKEHVFTAENHESMMVWLLGLQAKRDSFISKIRLVHNTVGDYEPTSGTVTPWSEKSYEIGGCMSAPEDLRRRVDLTRSQTMCRPPDALSCSNLEMDRHLERQHRLMRLFADSMDTGIDGYRDPDYYPDMKHRSWELPSESSERGTLRTQESLSMDEVFMDEHSGYRTLRKTTSNSSDGKSSIGKDRNASTDSTLDRDSDYSSMMSVQVAELEQQIMSTKCELAVMMNRETCFKTLLEQRDGLIFELDQKIKDLEKAKFDKKSLDKKLKESIRQLQNQNRFLTEEVKKLAKLQYDSKKYRDAIEAEINKWKRDYLFVLQSVITVPTGDVSDGMEVNLYGGTKHKERIHQLLEEARNSNPGLPTYESLQSTEVHVDQYGFTHHHSNEGLLLHYIAQQLNTHYSTKLDIYEKHQQKWSKILDKCDYGLPKTKELKSLCRKGIPAQYRGEAWKRLVYTHVKDLMEEKGPHYYGHLLNCTYDSQYVGHYRKQISLDLLRTMPHNINFNTKTAEGIQRMREVLEAYCIHSPEIGYCQGMNFIVGMCLLVVPPEDAFWTLIAITEKYFGSNYFDQNLSGAQADQEVLKDIMMEKLPNLYRHLDDLDIEISTVTLNWFLALFFDAVPLETLFRIWDCFLLEGPKVLFRLSLAVLKINEKGILMKKDTIGIMKHLKCCAKLMFDAEVLIKTAFEDLKPFPRRKDVSAKQVVYLNALKEKMRKRILYKRTLTDAELMMKDMGGSLPTSNFVYECTVSAGKNCVWIISSQQNKTKIMSLNSTDTVMAEINSLVESRVMCGCCIEDEMILLGTLSWHLHAYSVKAKQELWCIRLHESVMSIACLVGHKRNRLFCGLANGTIAILEQIQPKEPMDEPFYIPVSHSPVTALLLVDDLLWAGCGPNVYILHAETLDTLEKFTISNNSFDHVYTMKTYDLNQGVWIAMKGSSFLSLWDVDQLRCKLTFDVRCNKTVLQRKEDQGPLNPTRITSVLPFEEVLWVGTGDGNLTMYDVMDQSLNRRQSMTVLSVKSMSGRNTPMGAGSLESDRLLEKVNQLYYERLFEDRKIAATRRESHQNTESGAASETQCTESNTRGAHTLPKVQSAPLLDSTEGGETSNTTLHPGDNTQSPKRIKGLTKQKALDDSSIVHSRDTDQIRSINVSTGSIDVHEWQKRSSSTDTTYTDSSNTRQQSTTSYDNISLTSSSSIEEHRAHSSMPLYQRLMKLRASRELSAEYNNIPDTFSYDTISITSTSSIEETRAAIARVIRSKLQQQQLEKQLLAEARADMDGRNLQQCDTTSISSGSSIERDKRPAHKKPTHHHHHHPQYQSPGPTRIAVRIPKHLLPPGIPIEKLIPESLCSSSSLSGEDTKKTTTTGSKESSTTTTTNGIGGKYLVVKDENYNDTDGSGSDTKRYYSDPGPLEAVARENSGANLVYYAQHEVQGAAIMNGIGDEDSSLEIKAEEADILKDKTFPVPQVLVEGKPVPETLALKTANNNGKPNTVTVSILEQLSPSGDENAPTFVIEGKFEDESERGSVSDSSQITEKDRRKRLVKQKSYAEVVAAGSGQLRPLGVSRSFGNTNSPNSSLSIEESHAALSRSFDDRELSMAAKRTESLDLTIPTNVKVKQTILDEENQDKQKKLLEQKSSQESHVPEVFDEPVKKISLVAGESNIKTVGDNGISNELQRMSEVYPTTSAAEANYCGGARPKHTVSTVAQSKLGAEMKHLETPMQLAARRKQVTPAELASLPALIKGVKHRNEPLTPTETFVTGHSTLAPIESYTHDLSTLQEGGSYSEQSESDREQSSSKAKKSHVMDRQYEFNYIKETMENHCDTLITKAAAPCLTPIQEMTELSSSAPEDIQRILPSSARTALQPRTPLGEIITNNNQIVPRNNNNISSCSSSVVVKTQDKQRDSEGGSSDPRLPSPLLTLERANIPNPPHNTPDSYTAQDATLFFVEPFWDMGTSSSSPKPEKHDRSKPSRKRLGKVWQQSSSFPSDPSSPAEFQQNVELLLQAKIKISDQPIRCLNNMWLGELPVIVSCAGCHGDDEAVLKWHRLENEKLWTNDVILEMNHETKEPEIPAYKRLIHRLSKSSIFN